MTPPASVVEDLRRYDPTLRVRWARRSELWIIEKHVPERHAALRAMPAPSASARGWDIREGHLDGYVHVLFVHPTLLGSPVFWDTLAWADQHRAGGIAAMNRKLDAEEAAREAVIDREISRENEAAAHDVYDRVQWLNGNRVGMYEPEAVGVEHPEGGFRVVDRRVTRGG